MKQTTLKFLPIGHKIFYYLYFYNISGASIDYQNKMLALIFILWLITKLNLNHSLFSAYAININKIQCRSTTTKRNYFYEKMSPYTTILIHSFQLAISVTGDFMKKVLQLPVCTRDRQIVSIERVQTRSTFYMKSSVANKSSISKCSQKLFFPASAQEHLISRYRNCRLITYYIMSSSTKQHKNCLPLQFSQRIFPLIL